MISESVLPIANLRLAEVQRILAHTKKLEAVALAESDSVNAENAATIRGLFYVHLYGALEYSISLGVQVLLQEISKLSVPYCELEYLLHAVALDDLFRSLSDPGLKAKWEKRRELLRRQASAEQCVLNDTLFQDQLQNIWYETLRSIFANLCIQGDPVPEKRMIGYIDEIVEKRNEIAHGRQSAHAIGRQITSKDLNDRLDVITKVVNHVVAAFDDLLESRKFVNSPHRAKYFGAPIASDANVTLD